MGAVATILPLILQITSMIPQLTKTGQQVYDGVQGIWAGVTSENPPTVEEQKTYDDAMEVAFASLMKSTE